MHCRFREVVSINKNEFYRICDSPELSSDLIRQAKLGTIYVVKSVLSQAQVQSVLEYFTSSSCLEDFKLSDNAKVLEGCPNFRYTSNFISDSLDKYNTSDSSFYVFPWNDDLSPITSLTSQFYNAVLKVQGYCPSTVLSNTPLDSIIQRIHLIHYPPQTGRITTHVDPDNVCQLVSGIYLTQYGREYTDGGFYVINHDSEKVLIDAMIESGDSVLFYPQLPHGVIPVSVASTIASYGRLFIDMKVV